MTTNNKNVLHTFIRRMAEETNWADNARRKADHFEEWVELLVRYW